MKPLLSLCGAALLLLLLACQGQPDTDEQPISGRTMGTTYNIKYVPVPQGPTPKALKRDVEAALKHVNALMSHYIPDSELSRFNQYASTRPFPMSPQSLAVLAEAKRLAQISEGALDITLGPVIDLWGFGPKAVPERVPTPEAIAMARERSGIDKLLVQQSAVQKAHPQLQINLSPIAKGYGVDVVAELLEARGINSYLVEIGGELRVAGSKSNGEPWRIAIEKPQSNGRGVQKVLTLGDNAVATSGDYRNYFEIEGLRYSHLIDPSTAAPINHNLVSVTVVHPSCMTADGLATAISVLGKERGMEMALEHNLAVMLITRENNLFKEYTSPRFDQMVGIVN